MNYQRILMLTDLGADPQPACEAIRRFAPSATQVTVIAQQPPRLLAWVTPAAPPDLNDAARRALDDLRQAAEGTAAAVDVALESELTAEALADAVATYDIDLVVVRRCAAADPVDGRGAAEAEFCARAVCSIRAGVLRP